MFDQIKGLLTTWGWEVYLIYEKTNGPIPIDNLENYYKRLITLASDRYYNYPLKYNKVETMQNIIISIFAKHTPSIIVQFQRILSAKNEGYGSVNTYKQKDVVGYGGFDLENQSGEFSNTRTDSVNNNYNNLDLIERIKNADLNPFIKVVNEIVDEVCDLIW